LHRNTFPPRSIGTYRNPGEPSRAIAFRS